MTTQIIAVANQKGGVGKTTTSVNLAACLAERRKKVLIIDMDPQANATSGLGLDKEEGASIYRPLLGEGTVQDQIKKTGVKRLDIVPAEVDLAGSEIDIAREDNYLHRLKEALQELRDSDTYDCIFLDCPPSLGILTMNALTAANALLLPIQCEYYALEGLSVMKQLIVKLQNSGANPDLGINGIVMTMYDARTNLSQQVVQEVNRHFPDSVYETVIPRGVRLSEAPSFGQPIIQYDQKCTGSVAYRMLAKEFIQRASKNAEQEEAPASKQPVQEPAEAQVEPSEQEPETSGTDENTREAHRTW